METNYHQSKTLNPLYSNPSGLWSVSTEGDCEGRTTQQLGVYQGNIDEIALYLANRCMYSLKFSLVVPKTGAFLAPTSDNVEVSLDIESGTWGMSPEKLAEVMREVFKDRPVVVSQGSAYASFNVSLFDDKKEQFEKEQALAKLTEKDKKVLGLA